MVSNDLVEEKSPLYEDRVRDVPPLPQALAALERIAIAGEGEADPAIVPFSPICPRQSPFPLLEKPLYGWVCCFPAALRPADITSS